MRRWIAALLLAVGCGPIEAALPLALLGKQLVQSIVESLVEDAIHASLRALLGPCDGALASAALLRKAGAVIEHALFVIDLPDLGGAQRLREAGIAVSALMEFEGD